ncbi:dienelactone hydrolase family protein [Streptosporangium sp. NPDC000396]|uniref:dienelactone hydrolase family protein n=1 Tax=Streptosporangium sp. NPDC000396 TaxID=3366185 RepID=UPI003684B5E0
MCYDANAQPPIHSAPVTAAHGTELILTSADGARFAAYEARPERPSGLGVVVLPDNRGLRRFYRDLALRVAEQGHAAITLDYFGRSAGTDTADRDDPDFPFMRHLAQLTPDGLYGDIIATADHLRSSCGALAALGFCLGGRLAFQTADARFGMAGVIGFYGWPGQLGDAPGPTQLAHRFTAPILGIFGGADEHITAPVVEAFETALTTAGVEHEIVTYDGAPHSFFDVTQEEHAEASADAWKRVLAFLRRRVPTL